LLINDLAVRFGCHGSTFTSNEILIAIILHLNWRVLI